MPQPSLDGDDIATTSISPGIAGRLEQRVGQGSAGSSQNTRGFDSQATSRGNDRRDTVANGKMSTRLSSMSELADRGFAERDEGDTLPEGKEIVADDDDLGVSPCSTFPSEGAGVFSAGHELPTPCSWRCIPATSASGTLFQDIAGSGSAVKSSSSPSNPLPVPAVSNPSTVSDRHRPTVKSGPAAEAPAIANGSATVGTVEIGHIGANGRASRPALAPPARTTQIQEAEEAGEGIRRDAKMETGGRNNSVGEDAVAVPPRQHSPVVISDDAAAAAHDRSPGEGSLTQTSTRSASECTPPGAGVEDGEVTPSSSVILRPDKRQRRTFFEDIAVVVAGSTRRVREGDERAACGESGIPRAPALSPTDDAERAPVGRHPGVGRTDSEGETSDENSDEDDNGRRFLRTEREQGGATSTTASNSQSGAEATLDPEHAARLAVLLYHVHDCPGDHSSPRLAEVCRSGKSLMLHLQGCSGRTSTGEPCPMAWCRPLASLLHSLIRHPARCPKSSAGQVCSPDLARGS